MLGSGGTIKANRKFVENEKDFFICYADNITTINLENMVKAHNSHDKTVTIGVFQTNDPSSCGIVETGKDDIVLDFQEKPKHPKSNLAAAGIYLARKKIFDYFPDKDVFDLGFDILPKMVGDMVAYKIREYFLDIGTIANYEKANDDFRSKKT